MPVSMPFPDPLHPAVVHFPIALLLLGAPLAVAAVFLPRLAVLTAAVLLLGAAGAAVAVATGEREKRDEIAVPEGEGREVLRRHESAGELARNSAVLVAVLSTGAAVGRRRSWPRAAVLLAVLAAAGAMFAAWQVAVAGHTGGESVYHHGVGLRF